MEEPMTFEQFQSTRVHHDDLGAALADAHWEGEPPASGFVYLNALYIEDVMDHWPDYTKEVGKYHLLIGNREWVSNDLENLERELYEFAVSEGYTM
jgi:hypothetical protein